MNSVRPPDLVSDLPVLLIFRHVKEWLYESYQSGINSGVQGVGVRSSGNDSDSGDDGGGGDGGGIGLHS